MLIAGMGWAAPFLSPHFLEPISSFYGESAAILLGLLAFTFLRASNLGADLEIPRGSLMFLGFAALVLLHAALGRSAFLQQNILAALYLLWALMVSVMAWQLREQFGLQKLLVCVSWFTLAGALLSALIGLAQVWGIPTPFVPYVVPRVDARVYANTGQTNHLANYLCLGLVALGYLFSIGRLRRTWALLLALPLLWVAALSGSRSVWLYLPALLGLSLLWRWKRPSETAIRRWTFFVVVLGAYLIAQWAVDLPGLAPPQSPETVASRIDKLGMHSPVRLRMWHAAWLMFADAPVLGQGFRQFAGEFFLLNAQLPPPRIENEVLDHAHNLIFHTLAEFGIVGFVVLLAGFLSWVAAMRRMGRTPESFWLVAVAAILGIHSMLEYPLWYAYFLGVAALVLGVSESRSVRMGNRASLKFLLPLILAFAWMSAANIYSDYRTLQSLQGNRVGARNVDAGGKTLNGLLELQKHSVFAPFVELALSRVMELNRERIQDKLFLNAAVMRFAPAADVAYRHAILLALGDRDKEACTQWQLAEANYPLGRSVALEWLRGPGLANDAGVRKLLGFATAGNRGTDAQEREIH